VSSPGGAGAGGAGTGVDVGGGGTGVDVGGGAVAVGSVNGADGEVTTEDGVEAAAGGGAGVAVAVGGPSVGDAVALDVGVAVIVGVRPGDRGCPAAEPTFSSAGVSASRVPVDAAPAAETA
jgi:hypothetical protein